MPDEPNGLDSCVTTLAATGRITKNNVFETLTRVDTTDGSVQPVLAKSWERIDDLTWRFKLVENATFHDGAPFNAEAVVFNIERLMNPAMECFDYNSSFQGYQVSAVAVDDYTVDIKTDRPAPILPTSMTAIAIASPNTPIDTAVREPVGTGAYKFVEWIPGERVVIERSDNYWGEPVEVTKATYVFRAESAVRAAMVAAGEADIASSISVQDATNPETDFAYLNSETTRLRIDLNQPPLDDRRIRLALNYAVDRDAIQGSILSEDAIQASQYVVPGTLGHNPNLKPYPYDAEKAQALIAEAKADGVAVDTPIRLLGRTDNYPNVAELMEALVAMYGAVGLNVQLEMLEADNHQQYQAKPWPADIGPNLFAEQHDNNNGDAYFTVFNKYHEKGASSTVADPELNALIEKADAAIGDERRESYEEVFRRVHEDIVADVMLFHMVGYSRVSPRLEFKPTIETNSQIRLATVGFKD
jgi:peptide/nickel transport system substrate-binding protein